MKAVANRSISGSEPGKCIAPRALTLIVSLLIANIQACAQINRCTIFPADNIWNVPVDNLPLDSNSSTYVGTIGANRNVHADFGSGTWDGGPIGIPFITVAGTQPKVDVSFYYPDESDAGPYPIPSHAPIEGGPNSRGDRHVLVVDQDNCMLYELYDAHPQEDGSWKAGSGAIFDLSGNAMRPAGWTSADAAGLPILPGLVRYDEVASGEIRHALRFTAPQTRRAYIWPARHHASSLTGSQYPPMGQRFRLRSDFDISGFSAEVQVILRALKKYGMILADNGSAWYLSGSPDERWNNDALHELHRVPGSAFEAVNVSSLRVDENSAQAATDSDPGAPPDLPPQAPDLPPGAVMIDDDATSIVYASGWKTKSNPECVNRRYHRAAKPGAMVGFSFTGTQFTWITARGPKCGQATVNVDGATVATVDLYDAEKAWQYPVSITGLSDAEHTIHIVVLDTRNASSRGSQVIFDGFRVP